jgi:hypothetical protein
MSSHSGITVHSLERFLAMLGAAACLIITIAIWVRVSAVQDMWPLPGLYFIEMIVLSIISALAFVRGGAQGRVILWVAVGFFAAFSIMGAWSVGPLYAPITLIFAAAAVSSDMRNKGPIALHLAVCLIASLAQAALMFVMIQLL